MNTEDKKQFAAAISGAGEVYGKNITKSLMAVYFESLKAYTVEQVSGALSEHLSNEKSGMFFPKPADLIKAINKHSAPIQTAEDRASLGWAVILGELSRLGPYQSIQMEDKQALAAIRAVGGWVSLCSKTTKELVWIKKEFVNAYEALDKTPVELLPSNLPGLVELVEYKQSGGTMKKLEDGLKEYKDRVVPKKLEQDEKA